MRNGQVQTQRNGNETDRQFQGAQILVVDDEVAARVSLAEILRLEGYQVSTAASGEEALGLIAHANNPFDLMVLDLKMPGMDGLQVAEVTAVQSPATVIVLLTAYGKLETAIQAMRHGAHDYLLKPAAIPEILESVRKGLAKRRQEQYRHRLVNQLEQTLSELAAVDRGVSLPPVEEQRAERFIKMRDLTLDRQKHVALLHGQPLDLTPTEFRLLLALMESADQVCSPQELVRRAQGYETDAWGARAIVRVHIRRLRKKLEPDPAAPQYIVNVRGVGYIFINNATDFKDDWPE